MTWKGKPIKAALIFFLPHSSSQFSWEWLEYSSIGNILLWVTWIQQYCNTAIQQYSSIGNQWFPSSSESLQPQPATGSRGLRSPNHGDLNSALHPPTLDPRSEIWDLDARVNLDVFLFLVFSILSSAMLCLLFYNIKLWYIIINIILSNPTLSTCRRTDLKILHSAWHGGSDHGSEWWSDQTFLNAMPFFWGWKSNLQIPKLYHVNATDTFWETTIHSDSQQATFDQHVSFIGIFHTCHQMLRTNNHQTK